ncbi:MAG: L,D-transpeptidase [Taibaiella sp.]|nr:L,D-transpeptidase [Taibaiella sp.]
MYNRFLGLLHISVRVVLLGLFTFLPATGGFAQDAKPLERPKDVKVVREYEDGKGNIIRELQYKQGSMIVTETVIIPKPIKIGAGMPIRPDTLNKDSLIIYVDKSQYEVKLFYKRRLIRKYRAVFGPNPGLNKQMEGDRNTPEGWFTITRLNPSSKYNKFMELSYPDRQHYENFERLKQKGVIPKAARIGGNVGIHGIWKNGDDMIELGVGWTDGCVALKNCDIDELYSFAGIGTRVFIKK